MITFLIRVSILVVAIIMTMGFVEGFNLSSFIAACIFVSVWVTIVSFRDIFWWIFAFAVIFSLLHYDTFALYVIGIIGVSFIFDVLYAYTVRTANNNFIVLSGASFILAVVCVSILEIIQYHHIFLSGQLIIAWFVMTPLLFFIFQFIIRRFERFINLYTHGTDRRCHT